MTRWAPFLLLAAGVPIAAALGLGGAGPGAQEPRWSTRTIDRGSIVAHVVVPARLTREADRQTLVAAVDLVDLGGLRTGQPVEVSIGGRDGLGTVSRVVIAPRPESDVPPSAAQVEVQAAMAELPEGGAAVLRIVSERRDTVLRVPNVALAWRQTGMPADPVQGHHGPAHMRTLAGFVDGIRHDLGLDIAQERVLEAALAEARAAAFTDAGGDADPAVRRERTKQLRRDLVARLGAALTPEQRLRLQDLLAARIESKRRGDTHAGRFSILEDGRPREIAARLGATDGRFTELVGAPVEAGTAVIVGEARGRLGVLGF
ncbi:MAG: hypothetical protein ACOYOJ_01490 [Alsobacter sp.]